MLISKQQWWTEALCGIGSSSNRQGDQKKNGYHHHQLKSKMWIEAPKPISGFLQKWVTKESTKLECKRENSLQLETKSDKIYKSSYN